MRQFVFLLFSFSIACSYNSKIYAQHQNIVIDSERCFGGFNGVEEPCIAMDFKNPGNLVAASNGGVLYSLGNTYLSTDGGYTWYKDTLNSSLGDGGDPVATVDTNGFFYYVHLGKGDNKLVCQRSGNIAAHLWTDGSVAGPDTPKNDDKPWAIVDRRNNEIYLTWTRYDYLGTGDPSDSTHIYFSKSSDTGNTWNIPVRISAISGDCSNESNSVEGAMPCAGPNSEIYVAWAHNDAILFNRSFDGGITWLDSEIEVSNSPGGWYYNDIAGVFRSPGLPFIACDNSNGPFKGTVYINWQDQRDGAGNTDIWVIKSNDSGATWSSLIKVNDDTTHKQHFMSSMAVDPVTGYIYIVFYDRRNYTDSSTDVYLAISKDGATTFQNYKISDTPFVPQHEIFFGDYTDITAYNNVVRAVWASQEMISPGICDSKIIISLIDSDITGTGTKIVMPRGYNLQAYPSPFTDVASIFYELPTAEAISLFITDITGRKIATIRDNELMAAGRHTDKFYDGNDLAPGVYFICERSTDFSQTVKIVKKQ